MYSSFVLRSTTAAKRWENVPRRLSWPVRRTVRPSIRREPKANSSAVAQSIGPFMIASARRCICGSTLGCTAKPSG